MAGALEGVRVLDNGIVQAGTFPSRLLADFGAEVVRVENYIRPDVSRSVVFPNGVAGANYWETGGVYHEQHRNKGFCVGLDVRVPGGRDVFRRLAGWADIVLDSHPPGVMERLQLGYRDLQEVNPRVIFVTTSGYGYGGPYSGVRSYGMMTETMCGSAWLNGYAGGDPQRGACPLTDHPSTYHGAFLMMAALIKRRKTGKGMWLDMSQYEIAVNVLGDAHLAHAMKQRVPVRVGSKDPSAFFSGCFRCQGDDEWVTLSVLTPQMWRALLNLIGAPGFEDLLPFGSHLDSDDEQNLARRVTEWTCIRDVQTAFHELTAAAIAASPVYDVRDLLLDDHLRERGFFVSVNHAPEQAAGQRAWAGASAHLTSTPGHVASDDRAPMLGEHNHEVVVDLLGLEEEQYQGLVESGALGQLPAASDVTIPPEDQEARLHLGPAAARRSGKWDRGHLEKLRTRFGEDYGR